MKTFTAKQIHDDPTPIYQAALQGPVKITHKYHGDFVMIKYSPTMDWDGPAQDVNENEIQNGVQSLPELFKSGQPYPDTIGITNEEDLAKWDELDCNTLNEEGLTPYINSDKIIKEFMSMPQKPYHEADSATIGGIPIEEISGDSFEVLTFTHPEMKPVAIVVNNNTDSDIFASVDNDDNVTIEFHEPKP